MARLILQCLDRAFARAETILASVLRKARFRDARAGDGLNDRQRLGVARLLNSFEGKLTVIEIDLARQCSHDTTARDIDDLYRKAFRLAIRPAGATPATL